VQKGRNVENPHNEYRPDTEAKVLQGRCEGNCEEHRGPVNLVWIRHDESGHVWGWFAYCDEAREEDERRGLTVTIHDVSSPQPSRLEQKPNEQE
jgi:hypothetical protein